MTAMPKVEAAGLGDRVTRPPVRGFFTCREPFEKRALPFVHGGPPMRASAHTAPARRA